MRAPPADYKSALRRDQVPLSLSSFVICVYLCASVVKWCFGLG